MARPDSLRASLALCGDPVVGRALVLLLLGSGYDVRFLPASSLRTPGSLAGVRLLLLAPTPGLRARRREAILAGLRDGDAALPVLELATSPEVARTEAGHTVPWPCDIEELERRIEVALLMEQEGTLATAGPSAARS